MVALNSVHSGALNLVRSGALNSVHSAAENGKGLVILDCLHSGALIRFIVLL